MSYVLGYEHDIFVSYAHDDNVPMHEGRAGWVSTFIEKLKNRLGQKIGDNEAVSLWMDPFLKPYIEFPPQLYEKVRRTAVLLVFLSPAYLKSKWCREERQAFLKGRADESGNLRVFLVELDHVPRDERPKELANLGTYPFWVKRPGGSSHTIGYPEPGPADREYYNQLTDLATDLSEELRRPRDSESSQKSGTASPSNECSARPSKKSVAPATPANSQHLIYLAEVTDDLEPLRDETCRYLDQVNFRILPDHLYARGGPEFQAAVDRDLDPCVLFAQILSAIPGKNPPNVEETSYAILQHARAAALGKTILQWRAPDLQLDKITDPKHQAHRALLEGSTVMVSDFEAYKAELVATARRLLERVVPPTDQRPVDDWFVFVNHDIDDRPLAEEVCQFLYSSGCGYSRRMLQGNPDEIRLDLEANMMCCDGMIVLYGRTPAAWVRGQLRQWQKIKYRRERSPRALAVFDAPPQQKEESLDMKLAGWHEINCRDGLSPDRLRPFLSALTPGASA